VSGRDYTVEVIDTIYEVLKEESDLSKIIKALSEKLEELNQGILEILTMLYNYTNYVNFAKDCGTLDVKYTPISLNDVISIASRIIWQEKGKDIEINKDTQKIGGEIMDDTTKEALKYSLAYNQKIDNFVDRFVKWIFDIYIKYDAYGVKFFLSRFFRYPIYSNSIFLNEILPKVAIKIQESNTLPKNISKIIIEFLNPIVAESYAYFHIADYSDDLKQAFNELDKYMLELLQARRAIESQELISNTLKF
jgi:hypothetical protein